MAYSIIMFRLFSAYYLFNCTFVVQAFYVPYSTPTKQRALQCPTFAKRNDKNNIVVFKSTSQELDKDKKGSTSSSTNNNESIIATADSIIQHPVLRTMYSQMIEYKKIYGHPNIPLPEGKMLYTLRRLHIQNKLSIDEIALLDAIGFRFHSLEDVYDYADFDEMFMKLLKYRDEHDGDISPPKKYKYDPELGAWVTGIRRRGVDNISKEHRDQLDKINFQWISPRKCGSSFMTEYRNILERQEVDGNIDTVIQDPHVQKWIRAIQKTTLSETREHYMETILGKDWKTMKFD